MRIGIDFDNTIVCYDDVFHRIAVEQGLVPADLPGDKGNVRDHLRRVGREEDWTRLQGYVYGARLREAPPFAGVREFLAESRRRDVEVHIVSHKTRQPFLGPAYDLHQAARDWLEYHRFLTPLETGLSAERVHFALTKEGKLDRIADLGCDIFIDDLPEFLAEPGFPAGVGRILFDPHGAAAGDNRFHRVASWREAEALLLKQGSLVP